MSNERIDLTRFEWMISDHRKEAEEKTGITLLDLDAIAMVPEFIAELKRCYEEIDALRSITQDWVKIETFTDDGKDLSVDMEDSDGNCFSGYINRASE